MFLPSQASWDLQKPLPSTVLLAALLLAPPQQQAPLLLSCWRWWRGRRWWLPHQQTTQSIPALLPPATQLQPGRRAEPQEEGAPAGRGRCSCCQRGHLAPPHTQT